MSTAARGRPTDPRAPLPVEPAAERRARAEAETTRDGRRPGPEGDLLARRRLLRASSRTLMNFGRVLGWPTCGASLRSSRSVYERRASNVPDVDAARMQCGPVCRSAPRGRQAERGRVPGVMAGRWGRVQGANRQCRVRVDRQYGALASAHVAGVRHKSQSLATMNLVAAMPASVGLPHPPPRRGARSTTPRWEPGLDLTA